MNERRDIALVLTAILDRILCIKTMQTSLAALASSSVILFCTSALSLPPTQAHLSITIYHTSYGATGTQRRRWQKAHWAETDGGMSTIEFMSMHQDIARASLPDSRYVRNPVWPGELEVIDQAVYWIESYKALFKGTSSSCSSYRDAKRLGDLDMRQLSDLHIALTGLDPDFEREDDDEYVPDLDRWSAGSLRRYILASGQVRPSEITALDSASLSDFHTIVEATLSVLASEE